MPSPRNIINRTSTIICTTLLTIILSNSTAASGLDVITMKNGDIHNGTAALERYSIQTSYGTVSIPYPFMQQLSLGGKEKQDKIVTSFGDHFSGRITDLEIMTLRQAEPTLPLAVIDITSIEFSPQQQITRHAQAPDGIEMTNGDRFSGWINSNNFLLKGAASIHIFKQEQIHIIDIDSIIEHTGNRVQLTSSSGMMFQGELAINNIKAKTRYGDNLNLPLSKLNTLAFGVKDLIQRSNFYFRRKIDPATIIQDQMADGTLGPLMARLPAGQYHRGDLQGDGDEDERPPININLKPFAMGIFEITFDEYGMFCADTSRNLPNDEGWGRGRRPVINVTWEDAMAYTKWLSRKTGHNYRLPSDAEWEYAARSNSKTRYWWGQQVDKPRANCEGCGSIWDGEKSSLTGRFPPNHFGLHDTAGNVFEWVADCLHVDFSQDPTDGSPVDRHQCGKRIIRGGAWSFPPKEIRSANRWRDFPTRLSDDTGFRVARDFD
ncbi:MAG: formylglycine-generating enzyme family protein [Gammaproteobacteria bacterium]|nr:formylglycine-generating enzyme family protein [Gammaproteobacteria bacterium]